MVVFWISGLTSSGSLVGKGFFSFLPSLFCDNALFPVRRMPWFAFGIERRCSCIAR